MLITSQFTKGLGQQGMQVLRSALQRAAKSGCTVALAAAFALSANPMAVQQ